MKKKRKRKNNTADGHEEASRGGNGTSACMYSRNLTTASVYAATATVGIRAMRASKPTLVE